MWNSSQTSLVGGNAQHGHEHRFSEASDSESTRHSNLNALFPTKQPQFLQPLSKSSGVGQSRNDTNLHDQDIYKSGNKYRFDDPYTEDEQSVLQVQQSQKGGHNLRAPADVVQRENYHVRGGRLAPAHPPFNMTHAASNLRDLTPTGSTNTLDSGSVYTEDKSPRRNWI